MENNSHQGIFLIDSSDAATLFGGLFCLYFLFIYELGFLRQREFVRVYMSQVMPLG